jgi:hypothetical protein
MLVALGTIESCRIEINLQEMQDAEITEEHMSKELLTAHPQPSAGPAVMDCEGIMVIHE